MKGESQGGRADTEKEADIQTKREREGERERNKKRERGERQPFKEQDSMGVCLSV